MADGGSLSGSTVPVSSQEPGGGHGSVARGLLAGIDLAALILAMVLVSPHGDTAQRCYVILGFVLLRSGGALRSRVDLRVGEEFRAILGRLGAAVVPIGILFSDDPSIVGIVTAQAPLTAALVLLGRFLTYAEIHRLRRRQRLLDGTLIVGAGGVGVQIAGILRDHPEYGMEPVGFLDDTRDTYLPLPVLGSPDELERLVAETGARRVIIAFGIRRDLKIVDVVRGAGRCDVEVYAVPRLFELGAVTEGPDTQDLWGIPLVWIRRAALRSTAWRVKRAADVVFGGLALLVLAPLFGVLAWAVRHSSPGPILFRQERIGADGRTFELLKFRSLRVNEDSATTWSVETDERQTGIGRILRKTSLDELPQLINVVRGDMSLVGPRPERAHFCEQFSATVAGYGDRHRVPCGMTGQAQVHGLRGDTSIEERARFDNQYVERWSLWEDLLVLVRTLPAVVKQAVQHPTPAPAAPAPATTSSGGASVLPLPVVRDASPQTAAPAPPLEADTKVREPEGDGEWSSPAQAS